MSGRSSPARAVAIRTLRALEDDTEAHAAETLTRFAGEMALSSEDVRLARTLVFGTLRTALTLDFLYGRFLSRSVAKLEPSLRTILRVSAYQKYFLTRIPDYAIVNDAVEIGRSILRLKARETGFLNAVVRKIVADQGDPEKILPQGNKASALSVRYSFPIELVRLFITKYGGQKAADIMACCNVEPPLTVRVNQLRVARDELRQSLQAEGFNVEAGTLAPDALVVSLTSEPGGHSIFDSDAFRDGHFYVQDEGSQMVARIAEPFAQGRVLDLCAAPGGKTTHLAELTAGRAQITATDASARRLELLRENISRLGTPGIDIVPLDEVTSTPGGQAPPDGYNLVLVDAPCSGLGTVRRNPEIRYRVTDAALERHQSRQLEALETAADLTATHGVIVYSTCSISDQENTEVVEHFLKTHPAWTRIDDNTSHATWPAHPAVDGFEATILRRGQ